MLVRGLTVFGMLAIGWALPAQALSSFSEVRDVIRDHAGTVTDPDDLKELQVYQSHQLPHYEVTLASLVSGSLNLLTQAGIRTTTESADYYPRLTKLIHPNGICLTGTWQITEPSIYTGYFAKGKTGLFIGRVSTTMSHTEVGQKRGFGFVGKIFDTMDANKPAQTASVFSVDVGMGTLTDHFTETALTNEPEIGFDFSVLWLAFKIGEALSKADASPGFRPLYRVAELGMTDPSKARYPHWVRFSAATGTLPADEKDFRDELNFKKHYPHGLVMDIAVSDTTRDRHTMSGWTHLGQIALNESFVSYGCDRQVHFAHPKLVEPQPQPLHKPVEIKPPVTLEEGPGPNGFAGPPQ
jgi:hypothetical protein